MTPSFPQSSTVRVFLPILIFLAIIIAVFHEQLLVAVTYPSTHCPAAQISTNPNPLLASKVKTFRELPVLTDMSPAGDAAWADAALTPGGGFLRVRYNETTVHGWGISMFHAMHCLQTIRTIVRESPMMREESGGATHDKGMAHDHDDGNDDGHNMMDPEHVAHCIGYIAQVSVEIESFLPSFGAGWFTMREIYNAILILKHRKMTADASWLLRSSICSVPPTARSSLQGLDTIRWCHRSSRC